MKKKIFGFLTAFCFMFPALFALTACGETPPNGEVWDGTCATVSPADNGVITIDTAEELAGVAKAVSEGEDFEGVTLKLACDIDLNNKTWTPIGIGNRGELDSAKVFAGTFDGNGKAIVGLTNGSYAPTAANKELEGDFTETDVYTYSYGLFGIVSNATIKNLTITVNYNCNSATLKGDSVGGLVGFSTGGLTIQNCTVNGTIDGGYDAIGGLVGRSYNSTTENKVIIQNCTNNASVKGMWKAAGIVGYVNSNDLYAKIDSCTNNGTIESTGLMKTATTYYSTVTSITNFGWATTENTIIVTNNTNTGDLKACAEISEEEGVTNYHMFTKFANSVGNWFNADNHSYDFRGNTNTGDVYYNGEEVSEVLGVSISQVWAPYTDATDYDGLADLG
ncbi:MAG: hypothetical protein IJZ26_02195 [Clostridia bacterium]|nr:hypothetical protein [Clostridia bacterium]